MPRTRAETNSLPQSEDQLLLSNRDVPRPSRRLPTSPLAIASLIISTLSFVIFPLNLLGIFFGLISRRSIARSAGRIGGEAIAVAGIVVGTVSLIVSGIATVILGAHLLAPPANQEASAPAHPSLTVSTVPERDGTPSPTFTHAERQPVTGGTPHREQWDNLVVSDIDPEVTSLAAALDQERSAARREGRELLVLLVTPQCSACSTLEKSLRSAPVQQVLAKTWLVRLDVKQFDNELEQLGVPCDRTPAFVRLNAGNIPVDFLDYREWQDGSQENIALLLQDLLSGKRQQRKNSWRRSREDEETPI